MRTGRKSGEDQGEYIHRGIATRAFERRFGLADYVQVRSAELKDGMLSIDLVREIPEEMRPRRIEIGSSAAQVGDRRSENDNQVESRAA